ncbi:MAG: AMP-binding protein, partial [Bryobacteraceae bacterium]
MPQHLPQQRSKLQTFASLIDSLQGLGERPMTIALRKKGAERWSYAEIADHAMRLAQGLHETGLGGGHQIALLAENRPEWIIACLAVIRSGAAIVPLDIQLGDRTLRHALDDSEARLIFTTRVHADRLAGLKTRNHLRHLLLDGSEEDDRHWKKLLARSASHLPMPDRERTAALFYTSGTTGPPKGVPLSHGNLLFEVETLIEQELVREGDRVLLPLPLHHVYPFVIGMFGALATGAPLVLPHALTGPEIARALREEQATILVGVPRLYRAMYAGIEARAASAGWIAARMFAAISGLSIGLRRRFGIRAGKTLLGRMHRQFGPSLRMLASGGSALDPELSWKLEGLGWEIAIGYGLTETSPLLTLNPPGKARIGSAGRVIPGVELRIDTSVETAGKPQDVSPGEIASGEIVSGEITSGEILARGPNVFAGYRNLPEATAEAFTTDGWFRTG